MWITSQRHSPKVLLMKKSIYILILFMLGLGQLNYCLAAQLTVPADLSTDTLILNPQAAEPKTAVKGKIYYNSVKKKIYYYDDTKGWVLLGVDRNIATRIVSAWNSLGAMNGAVACAGDGTTCVNPKADFTCDGTDDQEMLNKAINFLSASGGVIYLLEGTYNISAALLAGETITGIVPHSKTSLIGTGRATILRVASGASNVNVINASGVELILITQLMIDGNSRTGSNNYGIKFNGVSNSKIHQSWIEKLRQGGIELSGAAAKNVVSDNHLVGNGAEGILLSSATNNVISNNQLVGNGAVESAYSISLSSANNNVISGNFVQPDANGDDGGINLVLSQNNLISQNSLLDSMAEGIVIDSSSRNSISYNVVRNSSETGIRVQNNANNNAFIGNNIYDYDINNIGNHYGIELLNNADANLFSSNTIYDSYTEFVAGAYGISISDATCDNNYLMGNFISRETGSQEIRDESTNTIYTDRWKLVLERSLVSPGSNLNLDVSTTPRSYVSLNPTADITLTLVNGKAAGDILILENSSTATPAKTVRLDRGTTVKLDAGHPVPFYLYKNDTLSLIWNGSAWVETGYSKNSP